MIIRNFYFNVITRIAFILVVSAFAGYFIASGQSPVISIFCLIVDAVMAVSLISYLNQTNKKITFFFDAVRNEDSNLSFPTDKKNRSLTALYQSMKRVNDQIQQLRIENIQQEQYFQTLIEHLATGIITFNRQGFIFHANTAAKKLFSLEVLTHLQQISRVDQKLYSTISNIRPFEQRLVHFKGPRGDIQLSLKATLFKTAREELTILSVQDIKNELDEKEVDSWLKLIRVQMHEIMNSITPITSLSESLSRIYSNNGVPVQPSQVNEKTIAVTLQGLNVIQDQGRGLMSFVESYRKLTKIPEPVRKSFKASDLITRVQILYSSLEKGNNIELTVSLKDPELEIYADENLISQVLINLLKNAIEANRNNPSGRITISVGRGNNQQPEISVIDNGPGISEENIDEIFVPFFTTKKEGSGIGLNISKQIMLEHGGNLKVMSVPGKETTFCLTF
jgi:two-component system, NtrC family, nitrogen regulation sensor histidine kinase NtrY